MPVYPTNILLTGLYEQTEHFLHKAVSEWQMTPPAQFAASPAPEKWSAAQCITHLNSYGYYYLPVIEQLIEKAGTKSPTTQQFKSGWLGNYFMNIMLPGQDGVPVKRMSSPKANVPSPNQHSTEVIATFIEQQEKQLKLLDKARNVDLNKIRCPISISPIIRLKLGDVFLFLIAHQYRHILQAERALTSAGVGEGSKLPVLNPKAWVV